MQYNCDTCEDTGYLLEWQPGPTDKGHFVKHPCNACNSPSSWSVAN